MTPRLGSYWRRQSPMLRLVKAWIRIATRSVHGAGHPSFGARSNETPVGGHDSASDRISEQRNRTGFRTARLPSIVSAVVLAACLSCTATAHAEAQARTERISEQNAIEGIFLIGLDYLDSGNPGAAIEIFSFRRPYIGNWVT